MKLVEYRKKYYRIRKNASLEENSFFCVYFWKVLSQQTKNVKGNIRIFNFQALQVPS